MQETLRDNNATRRINRFLVVPSDSWHSETQCWFWSQAFIIFALNKHFYSLLPVQTAFSASLHTVRPERNNSSMRAKNDLSSQFPALFCSLFCISPFLILPQMTIVAMQSRSADTICRMTDGVTDVHTKRCCIVTQWSGIKLSASHLSSTVTKPPTLSDLQLYRQITPPRGKSTAEFSPFKVHARRRLRFKKIYVTENYSFSRDSCKFPRKEIACAQNLQFVPKFAKILEVSGSKPRFLEESFRT